MKVILVYPNQDRASFIPLYRKHQFPNIKPRPFPMISLGMLYLCNAVKDEHEVIYVDNNIHKLSTFDLVEWILLQEPDVVGFGGTLTEWTQAKDVSRELCFQEEQDIVTIYGGPNATANPLKHVDYFDYVLRGWAEETFPKFLNAVDWPHCSESLNEVDGCCWQDHIVPPALNCDLSKIKYPARDQVDLNCYRREQFGFGKPCDIVVASRGCPYDCKFCSSKSIFKQKYAMRPVDHVLYEVQYMQEVFGTQTIHFREDNLTVNKTWLEELCRGLTDLKAEWICQSRVNAIDKETVMMMKDAGCKVICCGFESANDSTLEHLNKRITFQQIVDAINMMEECGILYSGGFMVGCLNEGEQEIKNTLEFVRSIQHLKHCRIPRGAGRFVGWPVSPIYDEILNSQQELVAYNWEDGECLIPNTYKLTAREVEKCIVRYT